MTDLSNDIVLLHPGFAKFLIQGWFSPSLGKSRNPQAAGLIRAKPPQGPDNMLRALLRPVEIVVDDLREGLLIPVSHTNLDKWRRACYLWLNSR